MNSSGPFISGLKMLWAPAQVRGDAAFSLTGFIPHWHNLKDIQKLFMTKNISEELLNLEF